MALADQHLAARGDRAEPRGDVDRAAVPVAVVCDRLTAVDADPDQREGGVVLELGDDAQAEVDRGGRIAAAQHDPVAERLDLLAAEAGEQRAHAALQLQRDLGRPVVALDVRKGGVADQIGEEECVRRRHTHRYLNHIPSGMSNAGFPLVPIRLAGEGLPLS